MKKLILTLVGSLSATFYVNASVTLPSIFFAALLTVPGHLTYHSMVTRDGRRMVSYVDSTDTRRYELVPLSEIPDSIPDPRRWTLYVVKSAHTDIGLHNSQYIQRHGSDKHIIDASRLIAADTTNAPDSYRYFVEGYWFWHSLPMDMGQACADSIVKNAVMTGRMGVGATCAGNHTHLFGYEELCRSAYTRKYLKEKWGIESATMLMADNPGMSWAIVGPYADAGIKNIIFAPNQWNPIYSTIWPRNKSIRASKWNPDAGGGGNRIDVRYDSSLPMVFNWEGADGKTLLVWASPHYNHGYDAFGLCNMGPYKDMDDVSQRTALMLDKLESRYPYDLWLAAEYEDDEPANSAMSDFCKQWNSFWACPSFATVGNPDVIFDELRNKYSSEIPDLRGDITNGWLQHAASTPELLSQKLQTDRLLPEAEALTTISAVQKGLSYPKEDFRRAWWYLIMNDEHSYGTSGYQGRRVFETWLQHRDWIVKAENTAEINLRKACESLGVHPDVPQIIEANGKTVENRYYRVSVTEKGVITSIYDKELRRELLDSAANVLLYTRDNHKTWSPADSLGAEIRQTVSLDAKRKIIYIDNELKHARDLYNDNRYYRYGYYAFPFSVEKPRFFTQLNGPVMEAYKDLTGHSTDAYTGSREWGCVENGHFGVAIFQFDSSLIEFGEIHPDKTCCSFGKLPSNSTIYSYAFTDWLQMHKTGGDSINLRFRYAITSYSGSWKDSHIPSVSRHLTDPYYEHLAKYISTDKKNVEVVALKLAEDGNGLIVRLRETEGRYIRARLAQSFIPGKVKLYRTNTTEEGSDEIKLVYLRPFEYVTVRIVGRGVSESAIRIVAPLEDEGFTWTGLVTEPRAIHGEVPGRLYLEWGAEMSSDFDCYELYRSDKKNFIPSVDNYVCAVKNEIYDGIPYRVARYEDNGLCDNTEYFYRIRKVWKDGRKDEFIAEFSGRT